MRSRGFPVRGRAIRGRKLHLLGSPQRRASTNKHTEGGVRATKRTVGFMYAPGQMKSSDYFLVAGLEELHGFDITRPKHRALALLFGDPLLQPLDPRRGSLT